MSGFDYLSKVRSLLAQANGKGVTEDEAAAFTAKATALMLKHGIDEALAREFTTIDRETPGDKYVSVDGPYFMDRMSLLNVIGKSMGVKVIRMGRKNRLMHMVGFENDIRSTEMLWTSLMLQGERFLGQTFVPWDESAKTFRTNWWNGFVNTINNRLAKTVAETKQESVAGTDLVLINRDKEVSTHFYKLHPSVVSQTRTISRSESGKAAGIAAGNRADIGGSKIGRGYARIGA